MRSRLKARCQARQEAALWREQMCLTQPTSMITRYKQQAFSNFCSNDYLGLAQHPVLQQCVMHAVEQYGVGAGASQLVCGHTTAHRQAEAAFAERFGFADALMFANGFMANLAVIQTLAQQQDVIIQDKENHASLIDAARSTRASLVRYRHLDAVHAVERLQAAQPRHCLLASDAVFSMSGDEAPIAALSQAAKAQQALFVLDDAHGVGVLGDGAGCLAAQSLTPDAVDILVLPLGKAFGSYGCMVLGDADLIMGLRQFARPYIYTTAPPPALAVAAEKSCDLIFSEQWRVQQLQHNIAYWRTQAQARGLTLLPSRTAIQSLVLGDAAASQLLAEQLNARGFLLTAMRPPTVAVGTSRLRITLNTAHTQAQIDALLDALCCIMEVA